MGVIDDACKPCSTLAIAVRVEGENIHSFGSDCTVWKNVGNETSSGR